MSEAKTDVFIAGAGPSGLVLAYQLRRLGLSTYIVDSADKASPEFPMYGRACTLSPRTIEMLDQLDLYDDMAQEGFVSGRYFVYRDGARHYGRGWTMFGDTAGTFFPQFLNLRLKYSEDVFRAKLAELGTRVHAPLKVVGLRVGDDAGDEYKVTVECVDPEGSEVRVRARYIVGADGGSSTVRRLAGIPFVTERTDTYWVRIDGLVRTNLPEARNGVGTMGNSKYGNVLWASLDHGTTRIGFPLTAELYAKYGRKMTQEQAVYEAKQALDPFELEFERVDWHTVYGIGQGLADTLSKGRVLLAGDAGHTHSSGVGQGMNTGMHDVVSLGWRLAGVLNGWYEPEVLVNYSDERLTIARYLINHDKSVSALISGEKPEHLKSRTETPATLLAELIEQTMSFISGLGISYAPNLLNDFDNALPSVRFQPGHRPYDVTLRKPGHPGQMVRLFELTKNKGKFWIVVFTGRAHSTLALLQSLRTQVDQHFTPFQRAVGLVTIIEGTAHAIDEHLGVPRFGKGFWDTDSSAHQVYSVSENQGALVVLRPDGIVGATAALDDFGKIIVPYLGRVIIPETVEAKPVAESGAGLGELINEHENLQYRRA